MVQVMRKQIIWLSIAILLLSVAFGCGGKTPEQVEAGLGEEFTLSIGQSARIPSENLVIKFIEVISDSRCPQGATCIWAGEASSLLKITSAQSTFEIVLTQSGFPQSETSFADYKITFFLQPYPELGKKISEKEYRINLTVTKIPVLSGGVLATFDVVGEQYSIFISNEQTIEQVLAVQQGKSQATIPSGHLLKGSVPYNQPWSWHVDSEDVQMAEVTIELCDGTPSQVEANLNYWVDTVKRFCPWNAKLINVEDFR